MARGYTVRFLVENAVGRTSSTWRVWSNAKSADIYFAHRDAAGELKGSLHASGEWQLSMTQQRVKTASNVRGWDGHSRHIMRWDRPPEMATGLTLAVEFGFLTAELQVIPSLNRTGCVVIPAAPSEQAILVAMFLAKPGAYLGGRWPGEQDMQSCHLADFPLPSGEQVYLVHTTMTPPPITLLDLDEKRRQFAFMQDTAELRARFCSVVTNNDGSRLFIEGAVHPDRVVT